MKFAAGVRLKDMGLKDVRTILQAKLFFEQPPKEALKKNGNIKARYLRRVFNQMLSATTYLRWRPLIWHKFYLNKISAAQTIVDKKKPLKTFDAEKKINSFDNMISFFCAKLQKNQIDFEDNTRADFIPKLYLQMLKGDLEKWTMNYISNHSPEELGKFQARLKAEIAKAKMQANFRGVSNQIEQSEQEKDDKPKPHRKGQGGVLVAFNFMR